MSTRAANLIGHVSRRLVIRILPIDQIVKMRNYGVTAPIIKTMRLREFTDASTDELIRLEDHGFNIEAVG